MRAFRSVRNVLAGFVLWALLGCGTIKQGSIGARLSRNSTTGAVHVRDAPEGLAAERAGLIPGDRIKMVDGVLVDELTIKALKALLRGPVSSALTLTVLRGERVQQVILKRQARDGSRTLPPETERLE